MINEKLIKWYEEMSGQSFDNQLWNIDELERASVEIIKVSSSLDLTLFNDLLDKIDLIEWIIVDKESTAQRKISLLLEELDITESCTSSGKLLHE